MGEIRFTVDETALQVLSSTEIKANFDETKAALEEMVRPYRGVIVDVSNVRETKADIARIRKIEKSIDEYRKMVKKYVLVPLTAFESKCKELSGVCTEAVTAMDSQVKEIERQQKEAKIESLREFFDKAEKKYPEYVSFDTVFDPTWENKTCPVEKCQNDILAYIGEVERDIDIIKSLNSEDEVALLLRYSEHGDLRDVMDYNQSLIRRKEQAEKERIAEEQRRIAEEQERIRLEEEAEKARIEAAKMCSEAEEIPVQKEEMELPFGMPKEEKIIPSKTVNFSFTVTGTPAEIAHIEEILLLNGISNYRLIYE